MVLVHQDQEVGEAEEAGEAEVVGAEVEAEGEPRLLEVVAGVEEVEEAGAEPRTPALALAPVPE